MEIFEEPGPCLYLDLDTIIRAPTQILSDLKGVGFATLEDFYRPGHLGSGIMYWESDLKLIYKIFAKNAKFYMDGNTMGDQQYLEQRSGVLHEYIQNFTQDICSYKVDVLKGTTKQNNPIVCFHGNPRPWEQERIPYA